MKGYLILLLLVLFQYAHTEDAECEKVELPKGVEDCKDKATDTGKECCYVSFKSSGKYYAMCIGMPTTDSEWEDEYDELKDMYSHVKAHCLSSSSIKVSFIALLGFLVMLL